MKMINRLIVAALLFAVTLDIGIRAFFAECGLLGVHKVSRMPACLLTPIPNWEMQSLSSVANFCFGVSVVAIVVYVVSISKVRQILVAAVIVFALSAMVYNIATAVPIYLEVQRSDYPLQFASQKEFFVFHFKLLFGDWLVIGTVGTLAIAIVSSLAARLVQTSE